MGRINLSTSLLRRKGVSFEMGPEMLFIKLINGIEVDLSNDDKNTVFLEAKFSEIRARVKSVPSTTQF